MHTQPIPTDWIDQLPGEASRNPISQIYDRIEYPAGFNTFRWDMEGLQAQVCHFYENKEQDGPCYLIAFIVQPASMVIEHMRDWTDAETDMYIVSAGGSKISEALMRLRFANADDGTRISLTQQLRTMAQAWSQGLIDELIDSFGRQMGKSRAVFYLREYQTFMKPRAQDSGFSVEEMPDGECRFIRGIG